MPDNPIDPTKGPIRPGLEAGAFQKGTEAFSELIKKLEEQSNVLKSSTEFLDKYQKEIEKGRVSSKLALEFEKKKAEVQNVLNKLNEESAIKILKYQKSLEGLPWEQSISSLNKYREGLEESSKTLKSSLENAFQLKFTKPEEIESFGKKILKGLIPPEGAALFEKWEKAGGGASTATNALLASLSGVALRILSAVGIFQLFQTIIGAVGKDIKDSYGIYGGFVNVFRQASGGLQQASVDILPKLRMGFTRTVQSMGQSSNIMQKAFAMGTEESGKAIENFNKLITENKLTFSDLSSTIKSGQVSTQGLLDSAQDTIFAIDVWSRASQALGLSSEQGAMRAGRMIEVFRLTGKELESSFGALAQSGNFVFQTFDRTSEKVIEMGEALRATSRTPMEAFQRSLAEIEKFGALIYDSGSKAGLGGAAISQMFDIMFNKINNLSMSFRLAALNALGVTKNLPIGKAIYQSYFATPTQIVSGLASVFAKSFGTVGKDSEELAGLMMQTLQVPRDEAIKSFPIYKKLGDVIRSVPGIAEGKFDITQLTTALSKAKISTAELEKVAAATKAAQDPMMAIQKSFENLIRVLTGQFNLGVLIRAPSGLEA